MEEEEEEKGKKERYLVQVQQGRKRSGGNRKEKVVAAREKLLVVAPCPGKVAAPGVAAVGNRPLPGSSAPVWIACRVDLRELPIATHGGQRTHGKT